MNLSDQLGRLDGLLALRQWGPGVFGPPATSQQLAVLRDAVAPMELPHDVVTLYMWHNGCKLPFLDGYGLRPIEGVIADRPFEIGELEAPPALLYLSEQPGGTGTRVGVTLDVPGERSLRGVWAVDTHDAHASRQNDDLASAIASLADLIEDLDVELDPVRLWHEPGPWPLPFQAGEYRLRYSPDAFTWPNPPVGTYISRFPDSSWPRQWTRSLEYR